MVATSTALIIAAGVGAAGTAYGAKKQGDAARRAADVQDRANTDAMDFEREQEATRAREWREQMDREEAAWNAQQAEREPYKQASRGSLAELVRRSGGSPFLPPDAVKTREERPDFNRPMPEDWQPGDPTGSEPPPAAEETRPDEDSLIGTLVDDPRVITRRQDGATPMPRTPGAPPPIMTREPGRISEAAYERLAGRAPMSTLMRGRLRRG